MRIFLPLIIILLAACNSQPTSSTNPSKEEAPAAELKILDLRTFKMKTPLSWTYIKTQGIDSYVGRIAIGKGDTLLFDYGRYRLSFEHNNHNIIMDTIDNSEARIIIPKEPGHGSIGIQFEDISPMGLKLTIVGDSIDPLSERDFLNAVRTLTFVTDPK